MLKKENNKGAEAPAPDESLSPVLTSDDIDRAVKILFSVFSRYGDAILSFKVMSEFIDVNPGKEFFIVTSNQLYPYAERIFKGRAEIFGLNKRKNPVKLLKVKKRLKAENIDIGFNPFSLGKDSEVFTSLAKNSYPFKGVKDYTLTTNLYKIVRDYLLMETVVDTGEARKKPELGDVTKVLIAPESSNVLKSMSSELLKKLVREVKRSFDNPDIMVAILEGDATTLPEGVLRFTFGKSARKSKDFLSLLDSTELFIGVDAGPLHLAELLGIPSVGVFSMTSPETILDYGSSALALRDKRLDRIYCVIDTCREPLCMSALFDKGLFTEARDFDVSKEARLEKKKCSVS